MKSDRNLEKTQQHRTSWDKSQAPCGAKEPDTEVQDWAVPASCGPVVLKLRPGVTTGSRCWVGGPTRVTRGQETFTTLTRWLWHRCAHMDRFVRLCFSDVSPCVSAEGTQKDIY